MAVVRMTRDEVAREVVELLGLPSTSLLESTEAISASLRRAASFMCPATTTALAHATFDVLQGLHEFDDVMRDTARATVQDLISYGDLLEIEVDDPAQARRQIVLGPPAYVRRADSGVCFLLGVRPEGASLLRDELVPLIEYTGYSRSIRIDTNGDVLEAMEEDGLFELQQQHWLGSPRSCTPEELIAACRDRIDTHGLPGDVELNVVDPHSSVDFYRGRWRAVRAHDSGHFVARRDREFGADLWCFVRLDRGRVDRLIDLPLLAPTASGFDEAWRLQAAIDASVGNAQRVRVGEASEGLASLEFYAPVPSWVQRRLDLIGSRISTSAGGLFAYALPREEVHEELRFLEDMLWTRERAEG